jgi:Uma2 family endonuclease
MAIRPECQIFPFKFAVSMPAITKYISPQDYLDHERASAIRHQYFRGEVFAMSGASREHNVINGNLFRSVGNQLAGGPCEAYMNDMRVKVSPTGLYTYPDMAVACAERQFEDDHVDTLLNPIVIAEVLSQSTEAYDRGGKFAQYRQIRSLREFLLVSQDQVSVEHYVRDGEQWVLTTLSDLKDVVVLPSIGCQVAVRDIYDRIEFPAPPPTAISQVA